MAKVGQPAKPFRDEAGRLEARPIPRRAIPAAPELPAQTVILKLPQLVRRQRLDALVKVAVGAFRHGAHSVAAPKRGPQHTRSHMLTELS
jgi:hypothetical protein